MARLFGELIGSLSGPVIVIGGGPSAPGDLERLRDMGVRPAAVLSANEHGHRQSIYPITHSVCLDPRHGEKRVSMEKLLRELAPAVPIISTCHFADYRLPEWTLAANTGITAIAVAIFMGATPAIVVGIDFYRMLDRNAAVYFHDPGAQSNSTSKTPKNFEAQVKALENWCGRRPPARSFGPLGSRWGEYRLEEGVRNEPLELPQAKYRRKLPTLMLQAHPSVPVTFKMARVEPGRVWPVSPNEAKGPIRSAKAKLIETFPAPGETTVNLPPDLVRAPVGYRPSREKARSPSPLLNLQNDPTRE